MAMLRYISHTAISKLTQLPARILLVANEERAVGLMLQKMPEEGGHAAAKAEDAWNRIVPLTGTLGDAELLGTSP